MEAESCLNVTAIICPNNLRLIIICSLATCVQSKVLYEGIIQSMAPWWPTQGPKFGYVLLIVIY
jgi:hypothetical protein